ncbi:MAG: glycosyltransferase family 9 protein [Planctomycetota bacterium]
MKPEPPVRPSGGDVLGIRLPNPVGDVVAAIPFLAALRSHASASRIFAYGSENACKILEGLPHLDEQVALPAANLSGLRGVRSQAFVLRSRRTKRVFLLPNSWSSAAAACAARVPVRIGRRARGRAALLTQALPAIGAPRPMTELYLELLSPPAASSDPASLPELAVLPLHAARAEARLAQAAREGISPPFLAVAPGAAFGPSKIYPPHLLAKVLSEVRQEFGLTPLLLGSEAEAPLLAGLAARVGPPVLDTGTWPASLGEMKALLSRSEVLLAMDTGARHLAAALGIPQVVLYGPTDPRWSDFHLEKTLKLRGEGVSCSPCHLKRCPIDHRCLTGIPPARVAAEVRLALDLRAAPAGVRA